MSESKKSGEFILKNLKTFNEVHNFFMISINEKIENSIDECIEEFSKNIEWERKFKFNRDVKTWLYPKNWKAVYVGDAKFYIDNTESDDKDNLWLSLFCQNSVDNSEVGFCFDKKFFGGKRTKKERRNNTFEDQFELLQEIGFKQLEDCFFLPIKLSNEALAKSWLKEDPFTPDDECFAPLREALEKLKQSVPIFEAIMDSALASQYS